MALNLLKMLKPGKKQGPIFWEEYLLELLGLGLTAGPALMAGMAATATASFSASIIEDVIEGMRLTKKTAFSSLISTATFGFGKYGADKLEKVVGSHWWNRGSTNAFIRYLGNSPTTHTGQIVDRVTDIVGQDKV